MGPPKFPRYPCVCMPCSPTPVVSLLTCPDVRKGCCLPLERQRRLSFPFGGDSILSTTTTTISGFHTTACTLTTPGSIHPITGMHAGSLRTCPAQALIRSDLPFSYLRTDWVPLARFRNLLSSPCFGLSLARLSQVPELPLLMHALLSDPDGDPTRSPYRGLGLLPSALFTASAFSSLGWGGLSLWDHDSYLISRLNHTACILTTPGSAHPVAVIHAGSLRSCPA